MAQHSFITVVIIGVIVVLVGVDAQRVVELRDAQVRNALLSISAGKLPPNDDKLVALIARNVKEVAAKAIQPTAGIEAAARQAQEAVSEVTAAYTAIIFQSKSVKEAEVLLRRYQDTVNKIVEFARSDNFLVKH